MEEKKNIAREEKSAVKEEKQEKNSNQLEMVGEYNINENVEETDSDSSNSREVSKVIRTRFSIQKTKKDDGDKEYENFVIAALLPLNGKMVQNPIRVIPKRKGGNALKEVFKNIMEVPEKHYLEVVKTISENNGIKNIFYSMQVSCKTDSGVPYTCPLEPVGVYDKAAWENLKAQLIHTNEI